MILECSGCLEAFDGKKAAQEHAESSPDCFSGAARLKEVGHAPFYIRVPIRKTKVKED